MSYNSSNYNIIRDRELGRKRKLGYDDDVHKKIYSNFDAYVSDIPMNKVNTKGGIFNLEFSLDGKILVAACEDESVVLYDASNQKCVHKIEKAHSNCVNCVRFINHNTFSTCSDDSTLKLWDTRSLKKCTRTLCGHTNWVKNIEYCEKDNVIVTSAFDGSIYTWDLAQNNSEYNCFYDRVFEMNGLMRTKLTADGSKLIIATTTGFLMVIHDVDLKTMFNDLKAFRPNLYRLMQLSDQTFPAATMYNYLFAPSRKRNRIEFIDDFPNDAEVISSIQIHPMGWNALSRNICTDDSREWTCVHDIQTRDPSDYTYTVVDESALPDENLDEEEEPPPSDGYRITGLSDIWVGSMSNERFNTERNRQEITDLTNRGSFLGVINSGVNCSHMFNPYFRHRQEDRYRIIKNLPRLTHYVEEVTGSGKGYIKELCYSTDGRLICSPYGKGVRLLGFNEQLQELCYAVPDKPRELFTLATYKDYHSNVVLCCKFNPQHYQMVSGCLGGEIVWYRPIL